LINATIWQEEPEYQQTQIKKSSRIIMKRLDARPFLVINESLNWQATTLADPEWFVQAF
jgi:hypothetical protein